MKKNIILALFTTFLNAQEKNNDFNPKKKLFIGFEIGQNTILSNEFQKSTHITYGVLTEYYFSKRWSVLTKLRYYDTEVAFSHEPNFLANGAKPYSTLFFKGKIISIPINAKWEFSVLKKLKSSIAIGTAFNIETKASYVIPGVDNPNLNLFDSNYFSINSELGISYFLTDKTIIILSYEYNNGGSKGKNEGFLSRNDLNSTNIISSIGIKYNLNFKKNENKK